jgi:hypothetical protein
MGVTIKLTGDYPSLLASLCNMPAGGFIETSCFRSDNAAASPAWPGWVSCFEILSMPAPVLIYTPQLRAICPAPTVTKLRN